jgi:hypothetical protein
MLHSNVSCCTCFMLFEQLGAWDSDGGMTRALGNGAQRAGGRGARRAGGRRSGGTTRRGAPAGQGWTDGDEERGWRRVELRRTGQIVSESYGCDDGVMGMQAGQINGQGSGCTGVHGKRPSDGILYRRTYGHQHVPYCWGCCLWISIKYQCRLTECEIIF